MQDRGITRPTASNEGDAMYVIAKAETARTEGDVVQWSDTASAAYPLGVAIEVSAADSGRVAGVVALGDIAQDEYGLVQVYGYNTNITTDGSVAGTDLWLTAGAGVAVGQTDAEVEADITTADISSLTDVFAWNVSADVGTVGQGFIRKMGIF